MAGKRIGRPSIWTPELEDEICLRILTRSLRSVCSDADMPAEETVYVRIRDNESFADKYARARQSRAYRRAEDIDQLTEAVANNRLDPQAARVAIDAIKWQAGKEAPKVFGEKLELNGPGGGPVLIQAITGVPQADTGGENADD
jgi:hypothetical protein